MTKVDEKSSECWRPRGVEVAEIRRVFKALQEAQVDYMKGREASLWRSWSACRSWMSGVADEIQRKFIQDVLVLEDKITEVENEPHEARR